MCEWRKTRVMLVSGYVLCLDSEEYVCMCVCADLQENECNCVYVRAIWVTGCVAVRVLIPPLPTILLPNFPPLLHHPFPACQPTHSNTVFPVLTHPQYIECVWVLQ